MQPLGENNLNVPAFLSKLWKMVNDPMTDHLISWGQSGSTFVIENKAQFWYELLPVYYKHNNMSSFVRQLNMYGFHKISTYEGVESDKDELQFFHQYFQRDKPELLKSIKRKVTANHKADAAGSGSVEQSGLTREELTKFLTEVTQLKGRQQTVDSQLNSMKQENAVLWRELALLRQKHLQQQKIVNKLIQFLVTLVQPSSRMGGLGQKRHYPLMIDEKPPPKKAKPPTKPESVKSDASDGPIIHELETSEFLQDDLLSEAAQSAKLTPSSKEAFIQSPDFNRDIVVELLSDSELQEEDELPAASGERAADEIFLNASTQDTLLSNLMNGNYNAKSVSEAMAGTSAAATTTPAATTAGKMDAGGGRASTAATSTNSTAANPEKAVATRHRLARLNSVEDMDLHIEHTQSELESLKDILNPILGGVPTVDANAFLNLFSDDTLPYGYLPDELPKSDPLVCGSELTKYSNNLDFSQLFDEDSSEELLPSSEAPPESVDSSGSITTPQIKTSAPSFPKV